MYDDIKRRRVHSDTQEDDEEEDSEEEESEEEEEEQGEGEGEDHPAYNLRKEKRQTNRYQPPAPCK